MPQIHLINARILQRLGGFSPQQERCPCTQPGTYAAPGPRLFRKPNPTPPLFASPKELKKPHPIPLRISHISVSYTHLTLPTRRTV